MWRERATPNILKSSTTTTNKGEFFYVWLTNLLIFCVCYLETTQLVQFSINFHHNHIIDFILINVLSIIVVLL